MSKCTCRRTSRCLDGTLRPLGAKRLYLHLHTSASPHCESVSFSGDNEVWRLRAGTEPAKEGHQWLLEPLQPGDAKPAIFPGSLSNSHLRDFSARDQQWTAKFQHGASSQATVLGQPSGNALFSYRVCVGASSISASRVGHSRM